MQVIGFNFEKIQAERKNALKGKLEINNNLDIKSIEQEKIDLVKEQTPLKFNFEFTVNYAPDHAILLLKGFVLAIFDKDKASEVLKSWKNKKIPEEARLPIFNFILQKCNLRALQLGDEFGLPPHIPFPRLRKDEAQKGKANYTG